MQAKTCAAFAEQLMDKVSYEIIAVYNDTPTFLNIGELNFVYNGNGWVHDLKTAVRFSLSWMKSVIIEELKWRIEN